MKKIIFNICSYKIGDKLSSDFEAYVAFCSQDNLINEQVQYLENHFKMPLSSITKNRGFTGEINSSLALLGLDNNKPYYIILVGIGSNKEEKDDRLEYFRRAVGNIIREAESLKVSRLGIFFPEFISNSFDIKTIAQELMATLELASYRFNDFLTDPNAKSKELNLTVFSAQHLLNKIEASLITGQVIGACVNKARYWTDLPANKLTPCILADFANDIAQQNGLSIKTFTQKDIQELHMGGLNAVSQGSSEECRLVILEYFAGNDYPTIALVGKGVTFDSGGLNLKQTTAMHLMKIDMAGAAAVIATMEAIAYLKPKVNIIAVAPLSENLPSHTAMKPGDVIHFYNGKTAEIKDTDAEGRLILADALSYVTKNYKLDAVISIATLTYACIEGLGHFYCGLMSKNDQLANQVLNASWRSGDRAWRLPLHDDYKIAIKSEVADLCNLGNEEKYRAGSILGAFFLSNFVYEIPFLHLDIAGTAFQVPDISYYRSGTTGFGVRLFIEFLTSY